MYIEQFCQMFSDIYRLELDFDELSDIEENMFRDLSRICYGYTDNEEEITNLPQYNFSDKQVVEKVDEVCKVLGIQQVVSP